MIAEAVANALARRFEGFRAEPYLCPAGIPTIGYGFTRYPDGRVVSLADPPMTREQAGATLAQLIAARYAPNVRRLCPTADDGRLGALIDFAFNLGAGNLRASTLRKKVLAGDWAAVPAELRKWTRGGGRILRGLVARREAEIAYI